MKIPVLFNYDQVESIDARNLKQLIAEDKIQAFRRCEGWVRIGVDPVRGDGGSDYDGPERRNIVQKPLTEEQKRGKWRCILGFRGPKSDW